MSVEDGGRHVADALAIDAAGADLLSKILVEVDVDEELLCEIEKWSSLKRHELSGLTRARDSRRHGGLPKGGC